VLAQLAGLGRAWRGEAFAIYFCYESMSNMF
jgi:hypothetical protein